jgi:hypothetical protein
MKKTNTALTTLALLALAAPAAHAAKDDRLAQHLSQKIALADQAFAKACAARTQAVSAPAPTAGGIEFRQYFLGFAPSVNFGLSGVLNLEIAPEVTLVWQKTTPPGR